MSNLKEEIGRFYGYPECCIEAFPCESVRVGPWMGTGFLACPRCAPTAERNFDAWVAEHIATGREASQPFPHGELPSFLRAHT
jgi:hypothetical protein